MYLPRQSPSMDWESLEVEIGFRYSFLTTTDLFWGVGLVRGPVRKDLLEVTDYERFPRDFLEVREMSSGSRSEVVLVPVPHVLSRYGADLGSFRETLDLGLKTAARRLREWKKGHNRANVHGVTLRCDALGFEESFEKEEQLRLDQFF